MILVILWVKMKRTDNIPEDSISITAVNVGLYPTLPHKTSTQGQKLEKNLH